MPRGPEETIATSCPSGEIEACSTSVAIGPFRNAPPSSFWMVAEFPETTKSRFPSADHSSERTGSVYSWVRHSTRPESVATVTTRFCPST